MLQQIQQLDQTLLLWFNGGGSLFTDNLALLLTAGLAWLPLYLALFYMVVKNNETMMQIVVIIASVALCVLLSNGVDNLLVKPLVARPRPTLDPAFRYVVDVVQGHRESGFSFFSSHAATTMGIATFFALLIRSRLLTLTMVCWSLLLCWTRLRLGFHYPTDILAGLFWGIVSGSVSYWAYYKFYYKINPKINYISSHYTATGYATVDIDVAVLAVAATFAAGVIAVLYQI